MDIFKKTKAVIRALPESYRLYDRVDRPMSLDLARKQHDIYRNSLLKAGLKVHTLAADENWYDCVFVEDTIVTWNNCALITRLQKERMGENGPVRDYFRAHHDIVELENPLSFIEGGDVLHTENKTFVGLSSRTNKEGIEELSQFMNRFGRKVEVIPVEKCLHLKTGATYLGENTILIAKDFFPTEVFAGYSFIECAPGEENAANAIRVNNALICSSRYQKTAAELKKFSDQHSLEAIGIDLSEYEKADGSTTCLSVIW